MNFEYAIRRVTYKDIDIVNLGLQLEKENPEFYEIESFKNLSKEETLKKFLSRKCRSPKLYLSAIHENKFVGELIFTPFYKRFGTISIGILNKYQNLGIGSKLITTLERYCIKHQYPKIKLNVHEFNNKANQFYLKHNYKEVSRINIKGNCCIEMEKMMEHRHE